MTEKFLTMWGVQMACPRQPPPVPGTIYRLIKEGKFPRPVAPGRWDADAVHAAWQAMVNRQPTADELFRPGRVSMDRVIAREVSHG